MDGHAVLIAHLVEFVNADDTAVGEDHGTTFEVELAGLGVALDGSGETGGGGTFTGGVDGNWGDLFNEFEELGFGGTGVTEEEDIDVSTELHAVGEDLFGTTEEEECNSFFDIFVAIDGGTDGAGEFLVEVGVAGHFEEFLFFGFGEHHVALGAVVV